MGWDLISPKIHVDRIVKNNGLESTLLRGFNYFLIDIYKQITTYLGPVWKVILVIEFGVITLFVLFDWPCNYMASM